MRIYHLIIFLLISNSSFASVEFEKQYTKLIEELRCMVCQNQNLAESEAPLAVDMKEKIREMQSKRLKNFLVRTKILTSGGKAPQRPVLVSTLKV